MMEHVLMDDRGNTTKTTYSKRQDSILGYVLFALMLVIGGAGVAVFYSHVQQGSSGPAPASTFTPFLSSPLAGFGGKCTVTPDAEDFASCSSNWEKVDDNQVLRCPSGYGNIEVLKVKDGETGHKNYRDMALLRHFCKGMDNCKLHLGELRAADDGMPLDDQPPAFEETEEVLEPELDPEAIIDDVAGVDSNGHVLMKHHGHHHHHHPGQVKIHYECEKLDGPFDALEAFFDDLMGPGEMEIEEVDIVDPYQESPATEDAPATEETPLFLSKRHGHCDKPLKNVAQDWDLGVACGEAAQEMTISCDATRTNARIYVLSVNPKLPHSKPPGFNDGVTDNVIQDTTGGSVETDPFFLSQRGHGGHHGGHGGHHRGHGGHHGGHGGHHHGHGGKAQKQLGGELTDICATSSGECSVTLSTDLAATLAEVMPEVQDDTPMHVKFLCSYEHLNN